jgi:hypothetical protein
LAVAKRIQRERKFVYDIQQGVHGIALNDFTALILGEGMEHTFLLLTRRGSDRTMTLADRRC